MTNSEGSRASQGKQKAENARECEKGLRCKPIWRCEIKERKRSDAEEYVYSEEQSESERGGWLSNGGSDETESEEEGEEVNHWLMRVTRG
ncbi:unnamed protein product [Microthlaspi erraticum]|uniref:Uncharacterized protein n=1 Tax=Microthlaspi erraticum TaxID=1685480 RepID=A0A6D2HH76_9BRAS|nr:unnamed protein product [Microthlaspi erraticum]